MIAARRAGTSLIICAAYEWKSLRRLLLGYAEVAKHKITLVKRLRSESPKFFGGREFRVDQEDFKPDQRKINVFTGGQHEPGGSAPCGEPS